MLVSLISMIGDYSLAGVGVVSGVLGASAVAQYVGQRVSHHATHPPAARPQPTRRTHELNPVLDNVLPNTKYMGLRVDQMNAPGLSEETRAELHHYADRLEEQGQRLEHYFAGASSRQKRVLTALITNGPGQGVSPPEDFHHYYGQLRFPSSIGLAQVIAAELAMGVDGFRQNFHAALKLFRDNFYELPLVQAYGRNKSKPVVQQRIAENRRAYDEAHRLDAA